MNLEKNNNEIEVFNELWEVVHKYQPYMNSHDCLFVGERLLDIQKKINKLRSKH